MFASAFTEEMDAQGRVLLPSLLREYAGIQEEVVVIGAGPYVALWSPERWRRQSREMDEQAWRDAEERRTSP
jgi:MraZ protein